MTNFEIEQALCTMTILCDTREQPTKRFKDRMEIAKCPYRREKLSVGDYSCACTLPDGTEFSMANKVAIERKMNIEELCMCFGRERQRFRNEFERAAAAGTKIYLLIENGNWERIYNGKYDSKYNPNALVASIDAYRARYGVQFDFCKSETTGKMIRDILYRELKEYLEREMDDGGTGLDKALSDSDGE